MARVAQTDAENANATYMAAGSNALNNANSEVGAANNDISSLEGSNPYTSKSNLENQNLLTSGAMNSTNTAAKQQLNDAALRTGTNTAALGRTIASNTRAGQRTMDTYNAGTAEQNLDKGVQLQQGLIGDRTALANNQASIYGTSAGGVNSSDGDLANLNGQEDSMWGNIIGGAAGAAGSAFSGKG